MLPMKTRRLDCHTLDAEAEAEIEMQCKVHGVSMPYRTAMISPGLFVFNVVLTSWALATL